MEPKSKVMRSGVARAIIVAIASGFLLCWAATTNLAFSMSCNVPSGELDTSELPEGTDVEQCDLVGRVIVDDGVALGVPEPGNVVVSEEMFVDGAELFQITVEANGEIEYSTDGDSEAALGGSGYVGTPECGQSAYDLNDLKEYGTYNFYVGDGSFPAALSRSDFRDNVVDAVNNITGAYNNCGRGDSVSASASYQGYTTYESDFTNSGGSTTCGDGSLDNRDGVSTWDAGNLDKSASGKFRSPGCAVGVSQPWVPSMT
jgi:hypothetical protein